MTYFDAGKIVRQGIATLTCPKHGQYKGLVAEYEDGTRYEDSCPKCQEEADLAEMQNQQAERHKELEELCMASNIEPEYYEKNLSDYYAESPSQKLALEAVKKMIDLRHGKIMLLGSNGIGKTMLGSIAARKLNGKIYSMYEISTMIRQSYSPLAKQSELEIVSELALIPFLAIDEIGRTNGSKSEQDWLSYIIDKRHTRNLPFMLMGNGHFKSQCSIGGCPRCIENFMDNDILSRFSQNSAIIVMEGRDWRKGGANAR